MPFHAHYISKKRPGIERQFDQSYLAAGRQIQGRVSYTRSEDAF